MLCYNMVYMFQIPLDINWHLPFISLFSNILHFLSMLKVSIHTPCQWLSFSRQCLQPSDEWACAEGCQKFKCCEMKIEFIRPSMFCVPDWARVVLLYSIFLLCVQNCTPVLLVSYECSHHAKCF